MEEEQLKILGSIKDEGTLLLIKEESEKYITAQVDSESVILNKSTNLFQILIAIFISIFTYLLSTYKSLDNVLLYNTGVVFSCFLSISLGLLLFVINPSKIRLAGASPESVIDSDIFNGSEYDRIKLLKNRIFCLNIDIKINREKQKTRVLCYRLSLAVIVIGMVYVGLTFASL
jgi:hypothetical protein